MASEVGRSVSVTPLIVALPTIAGPTARSMAPRAATRILESRTSSVPTVGNRVWRGTLPVIDESDAKIHSDRLPVVWGDRSQLVQLWQNLIANAIKFRGEETPRIDITAEESEGSWVFSIEDNGIGINKDELENIFVIFRRLHPELPGTGIGLSICKRIVERHGGRLWAESRGEGASFRFSMPKRPVDLPAEGDH